MGKDTIIIYIIWHRRLCCETETVADIVIGIFLCSVKYWLQFNIILIPSNHLLKFTSSSCLTDCAYACEQVCICVLSFRWLVSQCVCVIYMVWFLILVSLLGSSGRVVNSLDFYPAWLKSLGCFYFRCVLSSQWKAVTINLRSSQCQL